MTKTTQETPRPVTIGGVVVRCVIAAIGIAVCALAAALPAVFAPYRAWLTEAEQAGTYTQVMLAEIARFPIATVAALVALLLIARAGRTSLATYFGRFRLRPTVGVLFAAIAVTALACWVAELTGTIERPVSPAPELPVLLFMVYGVTRALLLQGIPEEWWFRGFAFAGYQGRPWLVLVATTLGFTVLHLLSSGGQQSALDFVLYLVLPLGMGFWAGVERWCADSVWSSAGVHGGIHIGLMLPGLLGWPIGPATWLLVGGVTLLAGVMRLLVTKPWGRLVEQSPARALTESAV